MSIRARGIRQLAATLVYVIVALGAEARAQALTVWVDAVRDAQTGQPDARLTRALFVSLTLHGLGNHLWARGLPPAGTCTKACFILKVRVTQAKPAESQSGAPEGERLKGSKALRLEILREARPSGQDQRSLLEVPSNADARLVGDAMALRCASFFEMLRPRPATQARQRAAREEPPDLRRRAAVGSPEVAPRGIRLDLGPSLVIGLDNDYLTVGVALGASLTLWRWVSARVTIGYEDAGRGNAPAGLYRYRAMPLTLLVGATWRGGLFYAGASVGLWVMPVWLTSQDSHLVANDSFVGAAADVSVGMRLTSHLSAIGTFAVGLGSMAEVEQDKVGKVYALPSVLFKSSLGLAWTF